MLLCHLHSCLFVCLCFPVVLMILCFEPVCCWLPQLLLPKPVLAVAVCGYAHGRCHRKPLRQICACVYACLSISH